MNTNLKQICIDHRVYLPGQNPDLEDIIYAFNQKLLEHQKSPAATCTSTSGDYFEWKQSRDALQTQLTALRNQRHNCVHPSSHNSHTSHNSQPPKNAKSPNIHPISPSFTQKSASIIHQPSIINNRSQLPNEKKVKSWQKFVTLQRRACETKR